MNKTRAVIAATAVGLALSACASPGTAVYPGADTITADVEVWRKEALPDLATLQASLTGITNAATIGDVGLLEAACANFGDAVNATYKWYVTPKGEASVELRAAFDDWKNAARQCSDITGQSNITNATELLYSGTAHLEKASAILNGKVTA